MFLELIFLHFKREWLNEGEIYHPPVLINFCLILVH